MSAAIVVRATTNTPSTHAAAVHRRVTTVAAKAGSSGQYTGVWPMSA